MIGLRKEVMDTRCANSFNVEKQESKEKSAVLRMVLTLAFGVARLIVPALRGTAGNVADAYISALYPNRNFGALPGLLTGWLNDHEKQSPLHLGLPVIPPADACTPPPGYWKTHASYGPAAYDETWALTGEDTPLFLSGQSYYDGLWNTPQGSAYYILAHGCVAAALNLLNSTALAAAQGACDSALALFEEYAPAGVGDLGAAASADWTNLATILDDYNRVVFGPGHCPNPEPLYVQDLPTR